ncbi:MAG TPA: hypothetical protein VK004_05095 [Ignavibacteria bacterium]|nr:hypothetical protein [Ignavibacteria bacterium]
MKTKTIYPAYPGQSTRVTATRQNRLIFTQRTFTNSETEVTGNGQNY